MSNSIGKDKVLKISEKEFWNDIKYDYIKDISNMDAQTVYPSLNPGPTKPDGSVNFECHCVGHLVASPCGYEFRNALMCQQQSKEELENGACSKEFLSFMDCAMRTQCFKTSDDKKPN